MAELLLEIFSEEIPSRMQARAAADLERLLGEALARQGLDFERAAAEVTPRRLAVAVEGLPLAQPDLTEERKGPRADAPPKAIEGFLRAAGITREQAITRQTPKGTFLFAQSHKKGRPTAQVLGEIIPALIDKFPWPKSMRWGTGSLRWVRPLQGLLCVLDGEVAPVEVAGLRAGNVTRGHRFMSPGPITVSGFADYRDKLRAARVILSATERREIIAHQADKLAATDGIERVADEALLAEVAGLVEWPVALMGHFDKGFLAVPDEVLIAAMRGHQKYFSLRDPATGRLAPRFIVVANLETADKGAKIIAGNERVLRARLADAKFFWDQDNRHSLEDMAGRLGGVVFHARLGSMGEKVARLRRLAGHLAAFIPGADEQQASRAAALCKADLMSGMVGEFPELQGIMGGYYAGKDGETAEVAGAIAEHYAPQGPDDGCPSTPLSVAVALADKLDTLVGFFGIDERPTGSKDPFALRRAALGVIRLILENGLRLALLDVLRVAATDFVPFKAELLDFFADRLKAHLREKGTRHDLVSAVFALGGEDDLVRLLARVTALETFLASEDGENLLAGYKRATNIVRIEEKKDNTRYDGAADPALLVEPAERALYDGLTAAAEKLRAAVAGERFGEAMAALAVLRGPVDEFFDKVTVNCPDAERRRNRLLLLSQMRSALGLVADFSHIEG